MLTKYAEVADRQSEVEVIDGFAVPENVGHKRLARLRRRAHRHHFEYSPRRGYIYVRSRAISSRCNDNFDEFPAAEIKQAYRTFVGKPVFVNHHNSDHRRARGVVIDAALHEDTNPDGTEDTWAEVLMEVDAVRFPVLAREVLKGNIARTSMGTDVAYSVCTACGNKATSPADYCQHIPKMKGMKHRRFNAATGAQEEVLIAERCYGLGFFENSLLVEDPADPTAYGWVDHDASGLTAAAARQVIAEAESIVAEAYPSHRDTVDELEGHKPHGEQKRPERPEPKAPRVRSPHEHPYHPPEVSNEDWNSRENIETNNDISPTQRKDWLKDRTRNQRGDAEVFKERRGPRKASTALLISLAEATENLMGFMEHTPAMRSHRFTTAFAEAEQVLAAIEAGDTTPETLARAEAAIAELSRASQAKGVTAVEALLQSEAAGTVSRADLDGASEGSKITIHIPEHHFDTSGGGIPLSYRILTKRGDRWHQGTVDVKGWSAQQVLDAVAKAPEGTTIEMGDRVPGPFSGGRTLPKSSSRHTAYGETKAPTKVDTMRAENCPVCGDDEGYNGDKCSVCGYMQPPSQFTDPDLTKARETDLRQEKAEDQGLDPLAEEQGGELQCTQCGEVFSAEGEAEAGTDPLAGGEPPDPEHPEDAEDPDAAQAERPEEFEDPDLDDDDLEEDDDVTADDGDDTEDGDDEEEFTLDDTDPEAEEEEDPTTFDPAVGEGRITSEPAGAAEEIGSLAIEPNMTCPVCGEGVLKPKPRDQKKQPGAEPDIHEVGTDSTKAKEKVAMNDQNPAQRNRSLMLAAIKEQQQTIEGQDRRLAQQDSQIGHLTRAVAALSIAAGVEDHPHFATLVRQSGLTRRRAADTSNSPEGAPATSTEESKKPDATDDPESVGATPGGANSEVTPEGVTDVNNADVVANPPVLDNLQDATAPVSGTDAVVPAAGDAGGASRVTVGTPAQEGFDKPGDSGWKSSARGEDRERFTASLRLARHQITAGVEDGEDLTVAEKIGSSEASLAEITAQISAYEAVAARGGQQGGSQPPRRLVPRAAQRSPQQGVVPSMQATAGAITAGREGEDEWAFGDPE